MSAQLDAAAGDPFYTASLPGDWSDTIKMAPFQSPVSVATGQSWWEGLIAYGITRAVDNRYGPTNVQGNTNPGSFAGANGRTYGQAPNATGQSVLGGAGGGVSPLLLLAGAGLVAFLALR